jgi:uncharacterized membrane protein
MKTSGQLEDLLGTFLNYGCWSALAVIGSGYAFELVFSYAPSWRLPVLSDTRIVALGIALFILLPIFRVLLMLLVFICERDFRFAFISGTVFAIILLGVFLGVPAT